MDVPGLQGMQLTRLSSGSVFIKKAIHMEVWICKKLKEEWKEQPTKSVLMLEAEDQVEVKEAKVWEWQS